MTREEEWWETHKDVIKAHYVYGAEIEYLNPITNKYIEATPAWDPDCQYRVKPESDEEN